MVRPITIGSLNKIIQKVGTEPVNFITVQWNPLGQSHYYSDRVYPGTPLEGGILELGNLENVVKISDNAKSQSVSIKLDDSNGVLKSILNTTDIHKRPVYIWQWFTGIGINEAFIIFEGEISSPIVWREGDRTLSFEVIERIEDKEVGFSPEEGQFDFIPEEMVGKAWPLGFGTNMRIPALRINEPPIGLTRHPIAFADPSLGQKIAQNASKISNLISAQRLDLLYAGEAAFTAFVLKEEIRQLEAALGGAESMANIQKNLANLSQQSMQRSDSISSIGSGGGSSDPFSQNYAPNQSYLSSNGQSIDSSIIGTAATIPNDAVGAPPDTAAIEAAISQLKSQISQMEGIQKQYEDKAAQEAAQISQIKEDTEHLGDELSTQEGVGQVTSVIGGDKFPRGKIAVKIGEAELEGHFDGDTFYPEGDYVNPRDDRDPTRIPPNDEHIEKGKYTVINPGATVKLISNYPIYYVVNLLPSTIHEVLAKRSTDGGAHVLTPVPESYYDIESFSFVDSSDGDILYNPTIIRLVKALTNYDSGWDDELFVSFTSPVGPNTIDIIIWLINTYTGHGYDPITFNTVRAYVDQYPSDFVLFDRKNIITLLQEIAFQARLGLWLSNGIFYVKYLPLEEDPVDTITEDDIELNSMEVSFTRTEDIVTKIVASYKYFYEDKKPNEIVLRYNINKYGTHEQKYDYFTYNILACVYASATFWMIRKGNTWKHLRIKTFLNKLRLETFDTVLLAFSQPWVANGPVKAIVESSKYDSASNSIELDLWLPVRIGEMTPYPFYWPSGVSAWFYFPTNEEITDGRVGNNPNAGISSSIPGATVTVDNSPIDMPGLRNNLGRPKDWGAANVSDNRLGQLNQLTIYQLGTSNAGYGSGVGTITLKENVGTGGDRSAYKTGDPVDIGTNTNRKITGVSSVLDPGGLTRTTTLTFEPALGAAVGIGAKVLSNLRRGTIENPISSAQDYNYRDYAPPGPPITPAALTPPDLSAKGGGGIPCKVVSGSGLSYQVDLYPNNTITPTARVAVTVLQMDPSETIPVDTWLFASKVGTNYYVQPEIWY